MGTLTGSTPSLTEHCPHKLPTSCRLTATPTCCACQDTRPHSTNYSTYVDGVGLVMRGTRWQRYCYFCQEFWKNRVAATEPRLEPSQTRIPEIPDQSPFLSRWFEYHRGYRLEAEEGGNEIRIPVTCEKSWWDTDPGTLPALSEVERTMKSRTTPIIGVSAEYVSLESTLDNLLLEAEEEHETLHNPEIFPSADVVRPSDADMLRERDNAERLSLVTALQEARDNFNEIDTHFAELQSRKEQASSELEMIKAIMRTSESEKRRAHRIVHQAEEALRGFEARENTQQRSAQRYARIYGTREEIEQQGTNYESPLTTLFTRAYERYRVAEEVRAEERASHENRSRFYEYERDSEHASHMMVSGEPLHHQSRGTTVVEERSMMTLDDDNDARPPPVLDEELNVSLACRICLQQKADTAVLPCGHLVMCIFCADIWVPTSAQDRTRPTGRRKCPHCNKQIQKRVRIYLA